MYVVCIPGPGVCYPAKELQGTCTEGSDPPPYLGQACGEYVDCVRLEHEVPAISEHWLSASGESKTVLYLHFMLFALNTFISGSRSCSSESVVGFWQTLS